MDGHPQATVVLFPCSLHIQGFKEATMGITSCTLSLFCFCFLFVSYSTERSKRGGCCIYGSPPFVWLLGFSWADGDYDLMMMVVRDSAGDAS